MTGLEKVLSETSVYREFERSNESRRSKLDSGRVYTLRPESPPMSSKRSSGGNGGEKTQDPRFINTFKTSEAYPIFKDSRLVKIAKTFKTYRNFKDSRPIKAQDSRLQWCRNFKDSRSIETEDSRLCKRQRLKLQHFQDSSTPPTVSTIDPNSN
ncbi:hypothetical protein WH47_03445 [Habropoda laboriosa]|uniref:Uncharacterized protein n=1 Tax=Habropoda laboriosa TaxID=597456 RepID=A0A0L7RBI3_9HYME|nr:hypothetical protein WH47_03445 [Habropoda laboriosa]